MFKKFLFYHQRIIMCFGNHIQLVQLTNVFDLEMRLKIVSYILFETRNVKEIVLLHSHYTPKQPG